MPSLILVRHGQSLWNLEDRFTGWVDVPLTEKGRDEARGAAELIATEGRSMGLPDSITVAYTSGLRRAQDTLHIILAEFPKGAQVPVIRDQALNERHYGDLQGLNKTELKQKFGEAQVKLWRRSYDVAPPGGESLKDTAARTVPFYERAILGDIRQGKNVLVVAHGNSLRSIIMQLDRMTPEQILEFEIGTGRPLFYDVTREGLVNSRKLT